jgi:hypothetical protein
MIIKQIKWDNCNLASCFRRLCLPTEYQTPTSQTLRHTILLMLAQFRRAGNRPRQGLRASGSRQDAWEDALQQTNRLAW